MALLTCSVSISAPVSCSTSSLSCAISAARQAVSFGGGDAGVQVRRWEASLATSLLLCGRSHLDSALALGASQAVRAFVSSADAATRTVLQPVLQAVHGGSDERGATPGSTVSGAGGACMQPRVFVQLRPPYSC